MEETEFEVEEPDPREELVLKLIEYKKYKEAAIELKKMEENRPENFTKPPSDLSPFMPDEQLALFNADVNIYDLLYAFQKMLRIKKFLKTLKTTVKKQDIPVKEQMLRVVDVLKKRGGKSSFSDLFPYEDKSTIIVTFLSLLELMKRQVVFVEQERNFEDLTVILQKEERLGELEDTDG